MNGPDGGEASANANGERDAEADAPLRGPALSIIMVACTRVHVWLSRKTVKTVANPDRADADAHLVSKTYQLKIARRVSRFEISSRAVRSARPGL